MAKTIYTAWVGNDHGGREEIEYNGNTSRRAIIDYVRANYGSGWTLYIHDHGVETDRIRLR